MSYRKPHADTISLIGMPGAGKSTVGVILAKLSGLRFVDTDLDIQVREEATLQELLERSGYQYLREAERQVLLELPLERAIISTGGSVVYSDQAMARLKNAGPVVYMQVELSVLQQRVAAAPLRGIASASSQSYAQVNDERTPLYEHYADLTVDAGEGRPEDIAATIIQLLDSA